MFTATSAADFTLVSKNVKVSIVYGRNGNAIDSITANLLAQDIKSVTGYLPVVSNDISKAKGSVIIIGSLSSKLVQDLLGPKAKEYLDLKDKWESYIVKAIDKPYPNIDHALLIAGSDKRGTAYGVFHISECIGVSPWNWWADVHPVIRKELMLHQVDYTSAPPSVKYRGIFLNDEDWCLQPWAAKTFEPETGDIGPKTYAKIFELLLRLKANLIWPAMHPSTKAFYHYPGNKKVAEDYAIVIGSSHAEPMLRNNVGEWDVKTMGAFNYVINKPTVQRYWEDRVKESSRNDAIYTLGMRGVHDSGIEGVKTIAETVPLLERIIVDQRDMLKKYVNEKITTIPQAFTVYKEVLEVYDGGLKLPEDVTVVWPDDNYGYIQRLSNQAEQERPGSSGIYYHASYWGRPHDYLWLSSTNPSLIREEMMKAYEMKSDRLWVLNVGDIKPLEYNIQLFLDMAYNAAPFNKSEYVKSHMLNWTTGIFGSQKADAINAIMWEYYQLAFERRPEFMGWSQTEPTTKTNYTEYNHFYYGDEAQQRIDRYNVLESKLKKLRNEMDEKDKDAFYELVYYPVVSAALMNKKFLYRDKCYLYAKQNRASAYDFADLSRQAYDSIVSETNYYNNQLAGGKWKYMMSMNPRGLPVYQEPVISNFVIDKSGLFDVIPEGFVNKDSALISGSSKKLSMPVFNHYTDRKYFIDVFLNDNQRVEWTSAINANWIKLSQEKGVLEGISGKKQTRIWVSIDWKNVPGNEKLSGQITIKGAGKEFIVEVSANNEDYRALKGYDGFIEDNG
ncbi:MAG: glycosyl hydrolase 115 family protein, partial [Bacteroidota bacterium]|nr:glycosyl hydrolase 115 family protein [Bacteroidota bacterium]